MEPDRNALLEAVNVLVVSPEAHDMFAVLRDVIPLALRHPGSVALGDGQQVLNPLLQLRIHNPEAYDKVLQLIDTRRVERGYDKLVPDPKATAYNKADYMREFMDQKRQRQRRAAEIENLRRPERDKLIGHHRLEFMRQQSLRWKEQLDAYIEKVRAENGGTLTKAQDRRARAEFWKVVDIYLDEQHEIARKEALRPSGPRASDLGKPLEELVAALTADPYATR